jgi:ABC-type siderophore export system fused ATPase/permease subunit
MTAEEHAHIKALSRAQDRHNWSIWFLVLAESILVMCIPLGKLEYLHGFFLVICVLWFVGVIWIHVVFRRAVLKHDFGRKP